MTTSRRPLVVVAESGEGMVGSTAPSARLRRDGRRPACGRRRITARPKRKPRRGSRGFGGRRSSRGKCDRPSRHGNTTWARSVHRTMSMSKNCRTGCSTGGPGSSRASGLRNMAGGCCGRLLGGETFQGERLTRGRVYDIDRPYASFVPNPGKQPGLRCCGRPILLRVIVREAAGLENDGA